MGTNRHVEKHDLEWLVLTTTMLVLAARTIRSSS
jgi:hypothetical protein